MYVENRKMRLHNRHRRIAFRDRWPSVSDLTALSGGNCAFRPRLKRRIEREQPEDRVTHFCCFILPPTGRRYYDVVTGDVRALDRRSGIPRIANCGGAGRVGYCRAHRANELVGVARDQLA